MVLLFESFQIRVFQLLFFSIRKFKFLTWVFNSTTKSQFCIDFVRFPGFLRPVAIEIHDHLRSMDQYSVQAIPSVEEDEWDTDGFVIPSLAIEESDLISTPDVPEENSVKNNSPKATITKEEDKIYLGPHGAPPSQAKQQELIASGRKQRFKQKLKEADRKHFGAGRENKVENLRELVGSNKGGVSMPKNSPRDWLDPHCHESQFEKSYSR